MVGGTGDFAGAREGGGAGGGFRATFVCVGRKQEPKQSPAQPDLTMGNRYHQVVDGEWIRPKKRQFREMCCDCHLVHDLDFRIIDGEIEFRATRNNRATSAARRQFKFERDE
jgi:hypothetical protein